MLESTALGIVRFLLEESEITCVRCSVAVGLSVLNTIRKGKSRRERGWS